MDGDLSGMLRQVMENPQFGQMIQAMKAQMGTDGNGGVDPAKVMEKMPEMMAMLGPVLGNMGQPDSKPESSAAGNTDTAEKGEEKSEETGQTEEASQEINHSDGTQFSQFGSMFFRPGSREKRNKLLSALKPYLSPARCALVDRAMSAMQMGELLGTVAPLHHDR